MIYDDNDTNDNNENDFFPHNIVVAATARMRRSLFLVHKSFSKYKGGCQIRVFETEDDKFIQAEEVKVVKTEEEKNSHRAAHAQCCRSAAPPFEDQLFGLNNVQ